MKPPDWNLIALGPPAAAFVIGLVILSASRSGTGDYAGALGGGLLFLLGLGGVCVLGEAAAVAALVRGERMVWLSILGVLVNGAGILPLLFVLARAD